jgi:hypothetical protein
VAQKKKTKEPQSITIEVVNRADIFALYTRLGAEIVSMSLGKTPSTNVVKTHVELGRLLEQVLGEEDNNVRSGDSG